MASASASAKKPIRPRLTPSTGMPALRANSAARKKVPSPPRTSTSSQPSAAFGSASTTSISTPSARMSSGARCSGPRSTASADSTRSAIPLSPNTFSTRRAVSVASSRPVWTTSRTVRRRGHCGPSATARCTASTSPSPASTRSVSARSHRKYSTLPDGPGSGLAVTSDGVPPQLPGAPRDAQHRIGAQHGVVNHPAGTNLALPHLKLRLHHGNDIRAGRGTSSQRG